MPVTTQELTTLTSMESSEPFPRLNLYATYISKSSGEIMRLKINPFNTGNPMTLKDAAVVALIVAFCIWVLSFFANASWVIIVEDPAAWGFEAIKEYIVAFVGTFIGLAGLEELVKRRGEQHV